MLNILSQIKDHLYAKIKPNKLEKAINSTNKELMKIGYEGKYFYPIVDKLNGQINNSFLVVDDGKRSIAKEGIDKLSIIFDLGNKESQKFNWILLCKDNEQIAFFMAQVSLFHNVQEKMEFYEDFITRFLAAIYIYTANTDTPTPTNAYRLICQMDIWELLEVLSKSKNEIVINIVSSIKELNKKLVYGLFLAMRNKLEWLANEQVIIFTNTTEAIDFNRLRKEKGSVYINVLEDKDSLIRKKLAVMVLTCALVQLKASVGDKKVYLVVKESIDLSCNPYLSEIRKLSKNNINCVSNSESSEDTYSNIYGKTEVEELLSKFDHKVVLGSCTARIFNDCYVFDL